MYICRKKDTCPKANDCPHAVKHFHRYDCSRRKDGCPEGKRCKTCSVTGSSVKKIMSKARSNKIVNPITQKEAEHLLFKLKSIAAVEYRLSGGEVKDPVLVTIDSDNLIRGLSTQVIKTLLPNYLERGYDRYSFMAMLLNESARQTKVRYERRSTRKYVLITLEQKMRERDYTVKYRRRQTADKILSKNYNTVVRNRVLPIETYLSSPTRTEPTIQYVSRGRNRRFLVQVPENKLIAEVEGCFIVKKFKDHKADEFYCFALIGSGLSTRFVSTMVKDGKFVDRTIPASK